jgi:hypothetical protein
MRNARGARCVLGIAVWLAFSGAAEASATGIITTVAGNGTSGFSGDGGPATSAQLAAPREAALDAAGNLWIVCQGNHRVRRVDAATGIITTVVRACGTPLGSR